MTGAQQVMCSSNTECSSSGMIGMMTREECCVRQQHGVAYSTASNTGSWSDTTVCTVCIGESHQIHIPDHVLQLQFSICLHTKHTQFMVGIKIRLLEWNKPPVTQFWLAS